MTKNTNKSKNKNSHNKYTLTETILRAKEGDRHQSIFTKIGEYASLEEAIMALDEHRFGYPGNEDYKTEVWTTVHNDIRIRSLRTVEQFMFGYDIITGDSHEFGETWSWSPITEDDDKIWPKDIFWAEALADDED